MLEAVGEVIPDAKYQCCIVHFNHNIFSAVPRFKMHAVAHTLKTIHEQENKVAVCEKANQVVEALKVMNLPEATRKVSDEIDETLTYMNFPPQHWMKIRTNNVIERLNRAIRRRTQVVLLS
jgi:putative transposase